MNPGLSTKDIDGLETVSLKVSAILGTRSLGAFYRLQEQETNGKNERKNGKNKKKNGKNEKKERKGLATLVIRK
jgi:hypothetical protein